MFNNKYKKALDILLEEIDYMSSARREILGLAETVKDENTRTHMMNEARNCMTKQMALTDLLTRFNKEIEL